MIQFFRKIRKSLLSQGKIGKYITYAIGEIFLVVLGILIALQINNWNEERKSGIQIELLLNNLVKSIDEDLNYLNYSAVLHEFRSNSLAYLLKLTRNNSGEFSVSDPIPKLEKNRIWDGPYPDTLNMDFVNQAIVLSGVTDNVVINKNVLDELKNTGLFSAIKNDSLKQAVNTYYSFVNSRFLMDDWNEDLTVSWRGFLRDTYGVLTMELYFEDDPINFVQLNEPVQVRIHEMIGPARYRSRNASSAVALGENLKTEIDTYLRSE